MLAGDGECKGVQPVSEVGNASRQEGWWGEGLILGPAPYPFNYNLL